MRDYLKKYEVTITTKGPLYIGSGKTINKKEYYFDEDSKKVYFFDFAKLFKGIVDRKLEDKYQEYMLNAKAPMDLGGFFRKNGVGIMDVKKLADYSVDAINVCGDSERDSFKNRGINTFIKESGNRNYIPGSSLKGAIRTALLVDEISSNDRKYSKFGDEVFKSRNKTSQAGRSTKDIESTAFNTMGRNDKRKGDAVNDVMFSVRVSDSEVIPNNYMTLCRRMDQDVWSDLHDLPIFFECVKPGVSIKTTITIDTSMKNYVSIDRIKQAISNYSWCLYEDFTKYFDNTEEYAENVLFLGGYTGFASKTVDYTLLKNDGVNVIQTMLNSAFRKHEHYKDEEKYSVSPRMIKISEYGSKSRSGVYEVGKVGIDFKEIK